jgi:hypothetical protein
MLIFEVRTNSSFLENKEKKSERFFKENKEAEACVWKCREKAIELSGGDKIHLDAKRT